MCVGAEDILYVCTVRESVVQVSAVRLSEQGASVDEQLTAKIATALEDTRLNGEGVVGLKELLKKFDRVVERGVEEYQRRKEERIKTKEQKTSNLNPNNKVCIS